MSVSLRAWWSDKPLLKVLALSEFREWVVKMLSINVAEWAVMRVGEFIVS